MASKKRKQRKGTKKGKSGMLLILGLGLLAFILKEPATEKEKNETSSGENNFPDVGNPKQDSGSGDTPSDAASGSNSQSYSKQVTTEETNSEGIPTIVSEDAVAVTDSSSVLEPPVFLGNDNEMKY